MDKEQLEKANVELRNASSLGAILDTAHGAAILGSPKDLENFEKQAKAIGENLHETSKKYAAQVKK